MYAPVSRAENMLTTFSAKGVRLSPPKKGCPWYEAKLHLMIKIQFWRSWGVWSAPSLPLLPCQHLWLKQICLRIIHI